MCAKSCHDKQSDVNLSRDDADIYETLLRKGRETTQKKKIVNQIVMFRVSQMTLAQLISSGDTREYVRAKEFWCPALSSLV